MFKREKKRRGRAKKKGNAIPCPHSLQKIPKKVDHNMYVIHMQSIKRIEDNGKRREEGSKRRVEMPYLAHIASEIVKIKEETSKEKEEYLIQF